MGEARVVTEEGAIQEFSMGLPYDIKGLLMTLKTLDSSGFSNLKTVVQRAMDLGAEFYRNLGVHKPTTALTAKRQD